ncbi:hypothetical protein AWR36_009705 [Microbulbifer flavimaris]|uniref:PilZ domain-containing protein n=1 Tax=Microbulbifer flavimaris TaxID=1781068 RepID=A0ABX4HZC0_9GAMM|nr:MULTISPECIES: hypothetical protein [Microbulbifer]KUJ82828.1 hypothetical protein AVO43_09680 [Microbulbifer sp. ZGT114]PCO05005.1 hypothetical protein AWR36_009705 [Microbulbifer flavimaris]
MAITAPDLFARLQLPPPSLDALTCGCDSERQLYDWLADQYLQPYQASDQQRLSTLLINLADEIARWRGPASQRLPMLELVREYALACVDGMALRQAGQLNARGPALQAGVRSSIRLLQQLALAYSALAQQLRLEPGLPLLGRRRNARALQRAVDAYRRLIQLVPLFSVATPRHTWRNLQLLVQLARAQELDTRAVRDRHHPQRRDRVANAYIQAALFASANPGQLEVAEQERLWSLTHRWAGDAAIDDNYADRDAGLLASLALDQPPIPSNRIENCQLDLRHFTAPLGWKIDLKRLLDQLSRQPGDSEGGLVRRVYCGWADHFGRHERRTPTEQRCEVLVGLGAVCHHLGTGTPPEKEVLDRFCGSKSEGEASSGTRTGLRRQASEFGGVLPDAPSLGSRWKGGVRESVAERYRAVEAGVADFSSGGMGLKLPAQLAEKVRVGELLAVRLVDTWQLAIIRWQYTLPDCVRAGLEVLASETLVVQVQRHTNAGHLSAPISGLLLRMADGERVALALPEPLFKCGDNGELLCRPEARSLRLGRQVESGSSFACFEFV